MNYLRIRLEAKSIKIITSIRTVDDWTASKAFCLSSFIYDFCMKNNKIPPIITQAIAGIHKNVIPYAGAVRASEARATWVLLIVTLPCCMRALYTKNITTRLIKKWANIIIYGDIK